jgi:hypothetical protein
MMEDNFCSGYSLAGDGGVFQRAFDELNIGSHCREIVPKTSDEVVHNPDAMTVLNEPFDQMAADEAGSTGDKAADGHFRLPMTA